MTYDLSYSNKFKKSLKRCFKRGLDIEKLRLAVNILVEYGKLPIEYKAHRLKGNYSGCWECHIEPDWLLVWQQDDNHLTLLRWIPELIQIYLIEYNAETFLSLNDVD